MRSIMQSPKDKYETFTRQIRDIYGTFIGQIRDIYGTFNILICAIL